MPEVLTLGQGSAQQVLEALNGICCFPKHSLPPQNTSPLWFGFFGGVAMVYSGSLES